MKYYKKLKVWKAANVVFNPETMTATSYVWWQFVRRIDGRIIFNNFNYSNSTIRHQYKLRRLLESLGISIDLVIEAPAGLQDLQSAINHYEAKIAALNEAIQKPRTHFKKNEKRIREMNTYLEMIEQIKQLGG